jgi:formate--tetrahydrofolate ligase
MIDTRSSIEIAREAKLLAITEIAKQIGLKPDDLIQYGDYKAKIKMPTLKRIFSEGRPEAKLILVTAITPTPAGEGKTTVSIGLAQALKYIGKHALVALREPSLSPCMGIKGGATGGGYSQVLPMEDINLHFTGDIHAITSAHNLAAAALDNHLHFGNARRLSIHNVVWKRVMDMNDRSLRDIVVGLGGKMNGVPRQTGFDITAASEVMAILCLSLSFLI